MLVMEGCVADSLPAYEGDSSYVFISYSHHDTSVVFAEIRWLQEHGTNVWFDVAGIHPGNEWSDDIAEHIEGCARFIYFITPDSVTSENCRRELNFAIAEGRSILSVHLEKTEVPRGIRLNLDNRQAVYKYDLEESVYHSRLAAALGDLHDREIAAFHKPAAAAVSEPGVSTKSRKWQSVKPARYVPTVVAVGLIVAVSSWYVLRDSHTRWLHEEAIPALEGYLAVGDWEAAYQLTRKADERVPDNAIVREFWPRLSWQVTIPSAPEGAKVYRRAYDAPDGEWEFLGQTPLDGIRFPYGLSQIRFELDGYLPLHRTLGGGHVNWKELGAIDNQQLLIGVDRFTLDTTSSLPEGMVRVSGWDVDLDGKKLHANDYFLGRYEVTNAEFMEFVAAGGYADATLWDSVLVDGKTLTWTETRALFVDRTGRAGPSTWEAGHFPQGEEDFPVSGVSWFEARAFARFTGKELPTAHHWRRATAVAELIWVLPVSNFAGKGPRAVSDSRAMSYAGTFDMAGNVREWTSSAIRDERVILGGSASDPLYMMRAPDTSALPLDRSPGNGFRVAMTADDDAIAVALHMPLIPRDAVPKFPPFEPVSNDVYDAYSRVFDYEKKPLRSTRGETVAARIWTRERVEYDAGYGEGRSVMHLYLPVNTVPPYQTVVYWPGWDTFWLDAIDEYFVKKMDFIVKSGRAVAFPVYKGTFGGGRMGRFNTPTYRDNTIDTVKDLQRAIDYLASRDDIDSDALAFFGYSWGGVTGPIALAQERRLALGVIYIGMLPPLWKTPEVDPIHALPRIDVPMLMLSGEFDAMVPVENARRYFDLIGTDGKNKRHVVTLGGHFVPRVVLIRETLDFMDEHFGVPSR